MGLSPEKISLTDCAEVVGYTEGNTCRRAMACEGGTPGVEDPIALHTMSQREPGRSQPLFADSPRSMPDEPKRRERQMAAGKSDRRIVPKKPGNAGGGKATKPSQRERWAPSARSGGEAVITRLERISERARAHSKEVFTNLYHHLDEAMMEECFGELKEGRAPGVDGVSKEEYREDLAVNIAGVVQELRRQTYRPEAVRRKLIPKGNGKQRPLGIPTTKDKLVQRGLAKVLERVYEEDFEGFSYGFRPGRSCHDALKELSRNIGTKKVDWIVEADIKGFYDNVDHEWLLKMVAHRVADPQVLWLIQCFLKAGVMEEGKRLDTEKGTPQGGVISPLLANVYLHYVLDIWFARVVKPRIRGEAYLVRYADDFVACFQYERDARNFHSALAGRLGKFGLEVEPTKTRMLRFGRYARRDAERRGERLEVFNFLGFTHYCGRSRKGRFKLKWRTAKVRMRAKLRAMKEWIKAHRTEPIRWLWEAVNQKLRGHYQYFAVSDNWRSVRKFRESTMWLLYKWLNRRSERQSFTGSSFLRYVDAYGLAQPKGFVNLNSAFV